MKVLARSSEANDARDPKEAATTVTTCTAHINKEGPMFGYRNWYVPHANPSSLDKQ